MADVLVVLITMVFFIQVGIIGAFILLSATYTNMGVPEEQRSETYQPMRILTARAQPRVTTPDVSRRIAA
jgi:hypothetical protein